MKKRTVAVLCAVAAVLGVIIGGTMAYLQHGASVVNTFTAGTIKMGLSETEREYIMVPGTDLDKDPKVSVAQDSESCYLFVKVEEENNDTPNAITWQPAEGWIKLADVDETVYYREYSKGTSDDNAVEGTMKDADGKDVKAWVYSFLENDQVTVNENLTKSEMEAYGKKPADFPQLTFQAYAIQHDWLTDDSGEAIEDIAAIWALAKDAKSSAKA